MKANDPVLPGEDEDDPFGPDGWPDWPSTWGPEPVDERAARAAWTRLAEPADVVAGRLVAQYGARGALRALAALPEGRPGGRFAGRLAALNVREDLARARAVGARVVIPGDSEWPTGVNDLEQPPLALWVRGPLDLDAALRRSVAIVGARASTAYGESVAAELAAGLGARGFAVVSGAAFGIDGAAHRGALAADAPTVAVLAGGVDRPYPVAHTRLLQEVARKGAVVSEVAPGGAPMRQRFLLRNRLIAAMTCATVVVEAGLRSGSRNTAGTAAALHRVVLAVPGPVSSMASAGCHEMIRSGLAGLVTDAAEVAEDVGAMGLDLAPERRGAARTEDALDTTAARVLDALPVRIGSAVAHVGQTCGLADRDVRAALGRLELAGLAERDGPGWRLVRSAQRAP